MERQELIDKILSANLDALSKVRQLVRLGMDEEDADDLVENQAMGQSMPVYYEKLDFEYDEY